MSNFLQNVKVFAGTFLAGVVTGVLLMTTGAWRPIVRFLNWLYP